MQSPQYQAPPIDPSVQALQTQAATAANQATQNQAGIDTASLMARYGTRLALAGAAGTPGAPLAVVPPPIGASR